jgi:hypothetical protein
MLSQRYRNEKKDCLNLKEMSTSCLPKKPLNLIVLLFLGFGSGRGKYILQKTACANSQHLTQNSSHLVHWNRTLLPILPETSPKAPVSCG